VNAIGRLTLDVDGERVVVGPWTLADLEEFGRTTDLEEQIVIFGRHVEESTRPLVDMAHCAAIARAWTAEVRGLSAMVRGRMH
jgi:hypothetical protein